MFSVVSNHRKALVDSDIYDVIIILITRVYSDHAQAVSCLFLTAQVQVRSRVTP